MARSQLSSFVTLASSPSLSAAQFLHLYNQGPVLDLQPP